MRRLPKQVPKHRCFYDPDQCQDTSSGIGVVIGSLLASYSFQGATGVYELLSHEGI